MSPDKKKEVKGLKVTQFYWGGKDVVLTVNLLQKKVKVFYHYPANIALI